MRYDRLALAALICGFFALLGASFALWIIVNLFPIGGPLSS